VAVRADAASWTRFLQDSVGPRLGRQGGGRVCKAAAQLSDAISTGGLLAAARAVRAAHAGRAAAWVAGGGMDVELKILSSGTGGDIGGRPRWVVSYFPVSCGYEVWGKNR
jgi:hypothetical protein